MRYRFFSFILFFTATIVGFAGFFVSSQPAFALSACWCRQLSDNRCNYYGAALVTGNAAATDYGDASVCNTFCATRQDASGRTGTWTSVASEASYRAGVCTEPSRGCVPNPDSSCRPSADAIRCVCNADPTASPGTLPTTSNTTDCNECLTICTQGDGPGMRNFTDASGRTMTSCPAGGGGGGGTSPAPTDATGQCLIRCEGRVCSGDAQRSDPAGQGCCNDPSTARDNCLGSGGTFQESNSTCVVASTRPACDTMRTQFTAANVSDGVRQRTVTVCFIERDGATPVCDAPAGGTSSAAVQPAPRVPFRARTSVVGHLFNPLGTEVTLQGAISRGIRAVLGIIGAIALLMFVWGGVLWVSAGGNDKQVEAAKEVLKNSFIGLLLILFSYTVVAVFFGVLGGG